MFNFLFCCMYFAFVHRSFDLECAIHESKPRMPLPFFHFHFFAFKEVRRSNIPSSSKAPKVCDSKYKQRAESVLSKILYEQIRKEINSMT